LTNGLHVLGLTRHANTQHAYIFIYIDKYTHTHIVLYAMQTDRQTYRQANRQAHNMHT